ncbi:MAG: class I SAM-dependent methyltransferase [Proteobacteria bacterium]|nr:class I SAM-dependent methyltransferase [Pseudomonadota bacterium]MBU4118368.1 class I SAM-dependent methyltransferase [Pseudomonadota bacterium]
MTICNPENPIAVSHSDPILAAKTAALAKHLGLPTYNPKENAPALLLTLTPERLELRQTDKGAEGPLFVDFIGGPIEYRRMHTSSRKEAIARAVGLKGGTSPVVLDLTAGIGRDSFILASLGCTVHMVERSPVLAALLADGIDRANKEPALAGIMTRMHLIVGDSLEIIRHWQPERPEVICIDPMYPHRSKSALVKKEMRLIRLLVGDDEDSDSLLGAALGLASRRVVVKRPRLAPALIGAEPNFTISGKNSRFDVYLIAPTATGPEQKA